MTDIDDFRRRLREELRKNREAFEGTYKSELDSLLGLSREEIDRVTPDATDLEVYDQLITVVKEASRTNVSQTELKTRIQELGDVAVSIAKKAQPLARLLV
ncbi:MAG TPA: hypothetical protein VMS76_19130 [Planctomycetota bacterium]|nr:hypothetical protein [Planctomycetota bacterium]